MVDHLSLEIEHGTDVVPTVQLDEMVGAGQAVVPLDATECAVKPVGGQKGQETRDGQTARAGLEKKGTGVRAPQDRRQKVGQWIASGEIREIRDACTGRAAAGG